MKRRALLLTTSAACLAAFGSIQARADVLADVKKASVLKVGTEAEFPPFDYMDEGDHVGFNVDFFNEVGKALGVRVEWVDLPWDGVLPGLAADKFDIVAGPATITKARLPHYDFTSPIAEGTVTLVKRANEHSIAKASDIAGKQVGCGKGSAQLDQLKVYADSLTPKAIVREYGDDNALVADLVAGRIVAYATSLPNALTAEKSHPNLFAALFPTIGPKTYLAFLARKDDASASLVTAVDGVISTMKSDGRFAALQTKWFGAATTLPVSVTDPAT
ncbi:transporter substrate-binding domain-containing protein [Acidisoma cellulosilytica]|uniref:Transporter substrate-binding domain-containing protein n=1 Tax=Acidisoma cellulosilyticum TaxID=2802395 RepID=A0A963YXE0_9PROT|nr:transporter substrate-binding domain-containing protein [Acidisoma cellulosilyticum]MCB8878665.1 transporter substrate-binding domain-containing protein [Acidisoma cellulosilyticum]